MSSVDLSATLDRAQLGRLTRLGGGTQGTVYRAPKVKLDLPGPAVFKEYRRTVLPGVDFGSLREMVTFLESLSFSEGTRLVGRAAWPILLVAEHGQHCGFVMPEVPSTFSVELHLPSGRTARGLAQFQHLLNDDDFLARRGISLSDCDRYELLADAVEALAFFHAHDITVGDLSPKNLLFSCSPHCRCYFVDCDAMSIGGRSVLPQLETGDWDVRSVSAEPLATRATDVYKLALLALRLLARHQSTRSPVALPGTTPEPIRRLIAAGLDSDPARRPPAKAWATACREAAEAASRTPARRTATVGAPRRPSATTMAERRAPSRRTGVPVAVASLRAATRPGSPGGLAGALPSQPAGAGASQLAPATPAGRAGPAPRWLGPLARGRRAGLLLGGLGVITLILVATLGGSPSAPASTGSWSSGLALAGAPGGNGAFTSISCPTSTFCSATVGYTSYTFIDQRWSPVRQMDAAFVSCPTSSFCAAVGGTAGYTYSDGRWSTAAQITDHGELTAIACASSARCVAGDNHGNVYTYTEGTWSSGTDITSSLSDGVAGLSCPATSFCVATDGAGYAYTDSKGRWSMGTLLEAGEAAAVSCATAASCAAVSRDGYEFTLSGDTWSLGQLLDAGGLSAISCPTAAFCVAVSQDGYEYTFSGSLWSNRELGDANDAAQGNPSAVSCPAADYCVTITDRGYVYTYSRSLSAAPPRTSTSALISRPAKLSTISSSSVYEYSAG